MFKQILMLTIFTIVSYQLYIYLNDNNDNNINKNNLEITNNIDQENSNMHITSDNFEHPVFGKPDKIIEEGYLFLIRNPQPWNAIVFNQTKEHKYLFIIKIPFKFSDISNVIGKWSQMFEGLTINNENELIIPAPDENSALAVLNLMLNNIKGDLTLENIIKNNLISISISKIKKYSSIRNKIIEQIMENLNDRVNLDESVEYQEDLAETVEYQEDLAESVDYKEEFTESLDKNESEKNKISEPLPYEGNEFSYF